MEQSEYEEEQEQVEIAAGPAGQTSDGFEDLRGQLAQKERDLVLAAELGKALLESNQELQRRYDAMSEEYSVKLESLHQEKYNLHLEIEKMETEHQNKLKDLQDDITTLRDQLQSSTQHQHDNDTETSRVLLETKQKSDYLAEQVQQACKREEELQEELKDEKTKNETNACVIQDHLEHISMLREQVEYLSEKLKETSKLLLEVQGERDRLLHMNERAEGKLYSLEDTLEQQRETIKCQESQIKEVEAMIQSKMKNPHAATHNQKSHMTDPSHQVPRAKGRIHKHQHPEHQKHDSVRDPSISSIIPLSTLVTDNSENSSEQSLSLSPHSSSRNEFGSDESLVNCLPHESLLSEFSTKIHHHRNRSDSSIVSLTEGSRKRHHETIAGESDDETESSDKSSKSSQCKQTLYSELMECSAFVPPSSSRSDPTKPNLPLDLNRPYHLNISDSNRSNFPTPPPENIYPCHHEPSSYSSLPLPSSEPLTPPEDESVNDNLLQFYQYLNHSRYAPVQREASLFEELSSKLSGLDRQNSEASEKSLFDELSNHMNQEEACSLDLTSTCLLGHPDFYGQSDGHDSYSQGARRSEDESSYTCEWPLLTSVSADMLDGDDFECDDDDFLVGNVAGSTLSIGDSGVGIMFNPLTSTEPLGNGKHSTKLSHSRYLWSSGIKRESSAKQDLKEACRLMKDLVDRLNGEGGEMHDLSSPENELPDYDEETFDDLFSLINKARQCVDDMQHGGVSHLRKFSARQWQLGEPEPGMEEIKIPLMEYHRHYSHGLPQWGKRKELKKSSSSSSLILRRSL